MRRSVCYFLIIFSQILLSCTSKNETPKVDYGLTDTGQKFNPRAWYGQTRRELAKSLPEISNIDKSISGGPFVLEIQPDFKKITFTFEYSEKDARLLNLHVDFAQPLTLSQAAKKFGVNLQGIVPGKQNRFWLFPITRPMIHAFMVNLRPSDSDSTKFTRAWITYKLEPQS